MYTIVGSLDSILVIIRLVRKDFDRTGFIIIRSYIVMLGKIGNIDRIIHTHKSLESSSFFQFDEFMP